jgi:nitrite reductase (NADH) small subunit
MSWETVCAFDDLTAERGVCALIQNQQVAVFRLTSGEVFAIDNRDPYCHAYVLSRGIVGSRGTQTVVISPMHKQAFALSTGVALDDPAVTVATYPTRVHHGIVEVAVTLNP